jgi:twitching motility protein PilJ
MTTTTGGARIMPILGVVMLLLLLGGIAVLLTGPGAPGPAAAASTADAALSRAQIAITQSRRALAGNAQALAELPRSIQQLRAASSGLNAQQAALVSGLADTLAGLQQAGDTLGTVQEAAADLDGLAAELTDRVYRLEGAITLQRQPAVAAQLERLRLLGDGVRRDVRSLAAGADPGPLTQPLLDAEMGLAQIIRGFEQGDPELGLRPVGDGAALEALASVGSTAGLIGDRVRDVVAVTDQLAALSRVRAELDEASLGLAPAPGAATTTAASTGLQGQLILGLLAGAVLLFVAMAWIYFRSAGLRRTAELQAQQTERNQQAIMRLLDELSSLADGDLTVKATVTEDITGAIADSINYAIEALRDLVATLNSSAIMVDGAAKQTDVTAQQLAEASAAQSKQLEAASAAIARMAASIEEVSGNAERSSDVARHSVDVAHKGGEAVRRTIAGMNTIRETIQDTSKRIKRLGESSQEIGNIIELITDIADQTNILALNASIQASMAGKARRGFAVVADEVQRLAERSANATKQIEVLVRTIQADTNEAVVSMERSTTDVVGGALLAENAGAALEEIEQVSNQIASLVQNISESAREQAGAAATVTRNMDVLQRINVQTAASTSETTGSIRKLAELAAQLRESVAGFRLPETAEMAATSSDEPPAAAADEFDEAAEAAIRFADQRSA